uniref:Uncharacterized protein n=2 Tax=Octopus bimaculoides TaxID=37653 RepID=A0A0L8FL26_OCTBM
MSLFPFTRLAAMEVLLLTLTTILAVTSDQEFGEAYYKRLEPGYSYGYLQTSPTQQFSTVSSVLECAVMALNSQSEFFTYHKVSHVCKNYSPKNIMTVVSMNDSNEISFYRSNSLIYNSILNIGSPSTWNVDKCNGIYCPNFFQHPILDIWNRLPIEQVKLVIYKKQTAVVTMVFGGRNTTLENWFSLNNLKSSPWKDLVPESTSYFSLAGFGNRRRFYVSAMHGGCKDDFGWLIVNERNFYCDWE